MAFYRASSGGGGTALNPQLIVNTTISGSKSSHPYTIDLTKQYIVSVAMYYNNGNNNYGVASYINKGVLINLQSDGYISDSLSGNTYTVKIGGYSYFCGIRIIQLD